MSFEQFHPKAPLEGSLSKLVRILPAWSEKIIYRHTVSNLVDLDAGVVDSAKLATILVWKKNVAIPTRFKLVFADRFENAETGQIDNWASCVYNPDTDELGFAMETIAERMKIVPDDAENMFLLAAHETTHRVQFHRGEEPVPNRTLSLQEYANNRHEIEAWLEALDAFKGRYPNATGDTTINGKAYTIPDSSTYSNLVKNRLK